MRRHTPTLKKTKSAGFEPAPNKHMNCQTEYTRDVLVSQPRKGDWFVGYGGSQIWPFDLRPEDINIEMIAHSLSNICRFGGHSREFYSVGQHSVFVSELLPPALQLCGLLHDGTEATMGFDCPRPVKYSIHQIKEVEDAQWPAFAERFGLPREIPKQVKDADNVALLTERRDILDCTGHTWSLEQWHKPSDRRISPVSAPIAKQMFLNRFRELTRDF